SLGYNIEYDNLTVVPDETKAELDGFRARGLLSSVTATFERNTVGDLLDPHDGSVLTLALEGAGGPLQGNFSFYRGVFEAKKYIPVFVTRVFAARFRIGVAD